MIFKFLSKNKVGPRYKILQFHDEGMENAYGLLYNFEGTDHEEDWHIYTYHRDKEDAIEAYKRRLHYGKGIEVKVE